MSGWPADAGTRLLAIAHAAVDAAARRDAVPALADEPWLREPRAVFVTLREGPDHDLRGCIGQAEPRYPLGRAVQEAARAAAVQDPRFPPVTAAELPGISIHVSVLTPLAPATADAIVPGRDGVVVRHQGTAALFLPEVATEQGWDRDTLLSHLCLKAGLRPLAWTEPGCALLRFTTNSFED
jgi:AmmeMemoRadiSam system protein A